MKIAYPIHLDILQRRFIRVDNKILRLVDYGDLKEDKPLGSLKETKRHAVITHKSWTDYAWDLKHRIDTAEGAELDDVAQEVEQIIDRSHFRTLTKDENIRNWLQSYYVHRLFEE